MRCRDATASSFVAKVRVEALVDFHKGADVRYQNEHVHDLSSVKLKLSELDFQNRLQKDYTQHE
jgi:hypothetical protein